MLHKKNSFLQVFAAAASHDQLQGGGEEDPGRDPGEGGLRQQDPAQRKQWHR